MTSTQKNNSRVVTYCRGVHGGRPTECTRDRLPPWQRNICGCGAATCDLGHIMTNCRHYGERPNRDDMATLEGRAVRWLSTVADTIWWWWLHTMAIESDGWPAATDSNRLSTVVCRDIISEDLINLGLAMPNCLADNITGHSCDPYVL